MVYADLNGWRVNGGTVPHEMALTEQKPDLVIIDKAAAPVKILLVELTVPWDSSQNFKAGEENSEVRKADRRPERSRIRCAQHALGDWLQRRDQPAQRCQPRVHLQPGGDQRDPEAQRGAGENRSDWIVPNMVGEEQPGVECWRTSHCERLKHSTIFPIMYILSIF